MQRKTPELRFPEYFSKSYEPLNDGISFTINDNDIKSQSFINDPYELDILPLDNNIESILRQYFQFQTENDSDALCRKTIHFNVEHNVRKKRGRQIESTKKRNIHSSTADDNIARKIQIHFLNFIISLINEIANQTFNNKKKYLKKFDYNKKENITRSQFNILKNFNICELINYMGISNKYKCNENINKKNIEKLNKYPLFEKLFQSKYLSIFNLYYNDKKPLKEFLLCGQKIILSNNIKSFYDLIENNKNKSEKIINFVEKHYIN